MIRFAAFDLDGTLVDTDLIITPRLRDAVNRAHHFGVIITIATGRDASLTTRFARELDITAPIICAQGGFIYDFVRDHVLYDVRLPSEIIPKVVEAAHRYGWNLHFEMANRSYLPTKSNHLPILYELLRYSNWSRIDDLLCDIPERPHKFLVTLNCSEDKTRVMDELLAVLNGQLRIVSAHPYLIEGVPENVTKGSGLAWLADHFNIPQAEVMAVGDNDNDIPMIEWAGLGVALGNASPAAKFATKWIAQRVDENGAALQ